MSEEKRDEKQEQVEGSDQSHLKGAESNDPATELDLAAELEKSKLLATENYERFLRVSADFENLRKRSDRERVDLIKFGHESLLKDLLPVVDSFQKALPEQSEESGQVTHSDEFSKGMELILKQLLDVLSKNGLKALEATGAVFDPNFHQAIQRIEKENVTDETVQDEFQKGYLLHEKLLRPAMVSVVVPGSESKD